MLIIVSNIIVLLLLTIVIQITICRGLCGGGAQPPMLYEPADGAGSGLTRALDYRIRLVIVKLYT